MAKINDITSLFAAAAAFIFVSYCI